MNFPVYYEATREKGARTYDKAVLLPADAFCKYFANPEQLAALLRADASDLAKEWTEANGADENINKRVAQCYYYNLYEHAWKLGTGRTTTTEVTQIEMQLSTWGFTELQQPATNPRPPKSDDMKASSKK